MRNLEKYQIDYFNLPFEDKQVYYRREKILQFLNQFEPKNILEVGCGLEPIFKYYNNFEEICIVEPGEGFVKNAKELAKLYSENAKINIIHNFFENSLDELTGMKFDFIIISSLLHELKDKEKFVETIKKVCTETTIIHVNVPNALSFHRLLAYESGIIEDLYELSNTQKVMQQFITFDIKMLKQLFISSGFEILDSGSYFIKPFTHSQMQCLLDKEIIDESILDGFNNLIKYFPTNGSEIFVNMKYLTK